MDEYKNVRTMVQNYKREERTIVEQLFFRAEHNVTIGTYREQIWKEMLRNIVPKKFVVERSVFIIDSFGSISKEVDLAILDEMYTPYIFKKGQLKFIPAEAVAVAVQCKSITPAKEDSLLKWVESVKKLKTSQEGLARMATSIAKNGVDTQKATRPILLYCHLGENRQYVNESLFDISIRAIEKEERLEITLNKSFDDLKDVFEALNFHQGQVCEIRKIQKDLEGKSLDRYRVKKADQEISLLSLNFILNQALMLLNNPMLFPHSAYVRMFKEKGM